MVFHFYLCHFLYWLLTLTFFPPLYCALLFIHIFILIHFKTPKHRSEMWSDFQVAAKWNGIKIRFLCGKSFFFFLFKMKLNVVGFFSFCKKQNRLTNEYWHWHRCSWRLTHTDTHSNKHQTTFFKRNMAHSHGMEIAWDTFLCDFFGGFKT